MVDDPVIDPRDWPVTRYSLGWSRKDLAEATGMNVNQLANYELYWDRMCLDHPGPGGSTPRLNACRIAWILKAMVDA
jgi:hypothetical protein